MVESEYRKPSFTADVLLFLNESVLLIKRGNAPFKDFYAFPGGFVNENESAEEAAERELFEETNVRDVLLTQALTVSTPGRDPRGWTVTACFTGELPKKAKFKGGDDAAEARLFKIEHSLCGDVCTFKLTSGDIVLNPVLELKWLKSGKIDVNNTRILSQGGVAFDHAKILAFLLIKE